MNKLIKIGYDVFLNGYGCYSLYFTQIFFKLSSEEISIRSDNLYKTAYQYVDEVEMNRITLIPLKKIREWKIDSWKTGGISMVVDNNIATRIDDSVFRRIKRL